MIYTGIDLIEIPRVAGVLERYPKRFLSKVFTEGEQSYARCRANQLARRFAAKEALSKALGTGIRKGVNFKDIEIFNDNLGKPSIQLKGSTANFIKKKIKNKKYSIYLSLSDDVPWAQATVIVSYN